MARQYWMHTLGCPKNQVDSDKLEGTLIQDGLSPARSAEQADLVIVNTCAFIEEARQESIDAILALDDVRKEGAELIVTGCMAQRYGDELARAIPEADAVVGFGVPVTLGRRRIAFDLLELPRPAATSPWAYVKVAEGCDRACGFCAIPSFRGPQRSRTIDSVLREVDDLGVQEVVLVAQDLAAYGRDQGRGERRIAELVRAVGRRVPRVRLLYLYPSDLTDELVETILETQVAYFDLSLQHVSRPLLSRMRRWGDGRRFLERIASIRALAPDAVFRSNFIVGYPGETEADHDLLLEFIDAAQLDWCGFFAYSAEEGTYAAGLDGAVDDALVLERLSELSELQDAITASHRDDLVGKTTEVLVDSLGIGRSYREAPEIDGIIHVPKSLEVGTFAKVLITESEGPDCTATTA